MSSVYSCPLDRESGWSLRVHLFRRVVSVPAAVRGRCAVVRASLVLAPLQLCVAANRAAVAAHRDSLLTNTVYTELLYNLSLSKNISQSLTKFGIQTAENDDLLVCFLLKDTVKDDSAEVLSQIEGAACDIEELPQCVNMPDLLTTYKLNSVNIKDNDHLLDLIISRIATKSFISH